jgi:hypothetical protein
MPCKCYAFASQIPIKMPNPLSSGTELGRMPVPNQQIKRVIDFIKAPMALLIELPQIITKKIARHLLCKKYISRLKSETGITCINFSIYSRLVLKPRIFSIP